MLGKAASVGLTAVLLLCGSALAQTANPTPGGQAAPPSPTMPSATSRTSADLPRAHASPSAAQHGADAAAVTRGVQSEDKAIEDCKAMPGDRAMRNATCIALMKKHPTMMNAPQ